KLLVKNASRDEMRKRMDDMSAFLKEQPTKIIKYDEQLVRRLIDKITIYKDKFIVKFKSGVTVNVEES
ncbi:MAG TPA: recombinase family protein, partial [Bacilli bacterium]|nr:recombinase family protein [Bacilli bacterium]